MNENQMDELMTLGKMVVTLMHNIADMQQAQVEAMGMSVQIEQRLQKLCSDHYKDVIMPTKDDKNRESLKDERIRE